MPWLATWKLSLWLKNTAILGCIENFEPPCCVVGVQMPASACNSTSAVYVVQCRYSTPISVGALL